MEGGNNPRSAEYYHPFIITDEPVGGYERFSEKQRSQIRVLAGVQFTRKHVPRPVDNAGRLCVWEHQQGGDRRRDDEFKQFSEFRNSLVPRCEEDNKPALMQIKPNVTWPDVVYYHSYTTPYMGWKINIVDNFRKRPGFGSAVRPGAPNVLLGLVVVAVIR